MQASVIHSVTVTAAVAASYLGIGEHTFRHEYSDDDNREFLEHLKQLEVARLSLVSGIEIGLRHWIVCNFICIEGVQMLVGLLQFLLRFFVFLRLLLERLDHVAVGGRLILVSMRVDHLAGFANESEEEERHTDEIESTEAHRNELNRIHLSTTVRRSEIRR